MNTEDDFFESFTRSAFRLETLPQYLGTSDPAFHAFREEGRILPLSERPTKQEWVQLVTDATAAGKRLYRVHVVDRPLSPYLEYELAFYPENAQAGEEVRIADRATHPDLATLTQDFWLLDAEGPKAVALLMHYDAEGRFLREEPTDDPAIIEACRRQRDLALAHSVSLEEFMASTNS